MVRRGSLHLASFALFAAATLAHPSAAVGQDSLPSGGIPVTSELVVRSCVRCHRQDEAGRMSRISYMRKTPEGWSQSIRRMVSLNGVSLDPDEARDIVRYLSNAHGIAPDELRPAFYEVERRPLEERPELPEVVRETCTACHSIGRIATQRRTGDEWALVAETHRGLYPLIDRQVFRRGSIPEEEGDYDFPVQAAVARLSASYPLETTAWSDWARNMRPARIDGVWAVRGYELGRGPVYGTMTVRGTGDGGDTFSTTGRYVYAAENRNVTRSGESTVYTGYQWRGWSQGSGDEHGDLREVLFVERDWDEMFGRWFTGAYEELGVDVRMVRVGSEPIVLGAYPEHVKAGEEASLRIYGANLPSDLSAADVALGAGVEVLSVEGSGETLNVRVRVSEDGLEGARDVVVAGTRGEGAVVVYREVDYVRVAPGRAIAHAGGANFAPGLARFEAVGYTDGPDGRRDTDDDVRIGAVPATWSLDEYPRTWGDDDLRFVGRIDQRGRFTPALDGPNPNRSGNRNNIGEIWVRAEHRPAGVSDSDEPLRARGFLLVSPPDYIEWEPRDDRSAVSDDASGGGGGR
jgi:quinohemoprotein amine dehydrogenase